MTRFHSLSNLKNHSVGKRTGRKVFGSAFNSLPMHPSRF